MSCLEHIHSRDIIYRDLKVGVGGAVVLWSIRAQSSRLGVLEDNCYVNEVGGEHSFT